MVSLKDFGDKRVGELKILITFREWIESSWYNEGVIKVKNGEFGFDILGTTFSGMIGEKGDQWSFVVVYLVLF